ncbi:MAG: transposase [Xanthobacteraceae bacterium]|nr:transposase [Xanthobacteraceae bacterium]
MTTVAVLSGPERRRRWSASEKARIVALSYAPGGTVTEVARRHDVHANLLHHWRRQAKRAAEVGGGMKLLPVTVTAPVNRTAALGSIEIELGDAVRVRVDAAVDEAALGRVLRALRR